MPLVSITRFRARAIWFVPMFIYHAQRSISQIRGVQGCLSLALLKDRSRVSWTMTMWEVERSMNAYMTRGSHRVLYHAFRVRNPTRVALAGHSVARVI